MTFRQFFSERGFPSLLAVALIVGLAVAIPLLRGGAPDADPQAPPEAAVAVVMTAFQESFETTLVATGRLAFAKRAELGFEAGGRIVALLADEGSRVPAGAELGRLDTSGLDARAAALDARQAAAQARLDEARSGPRRERIDAAEAAVRALEAELASAQARAARLEPLSGRGSVSEEQWDNARFAVDTVRGRLGAERARLQELKAGTRRERVAVLEAELALVAAERQSLESERDDHVVRAPWAGVVLARRRDEGAVVQAGQAVLELASSGPLEAWVGVPEAHLAEMSEGREITLESGEERWVATVLSRNAEVRADSRTVLVRAVLARADAGQAGAIVRLPLHRSVRKRGCWIPVDALSRGRRGLFRALAVEGRDAEASSRPERGRLQVRLVEVLHSDGQRAYVRGTLEEGEWLAVGTGDRLIPGQRVRVVEAASLAGASQDGEEAR